MSTKTALGASPAAAQPQQRNTTDFKLEKRGKSTSVVAATSNSSSTTLDDVLPSTFSVVSFIVCFIMSSLVLFMKLYLIPDLPWWLTFVSVSGFWVLRSSLEPDMDPRNNQSGKTASAAAAKGSSATSVKPKNKDL